MSVAVFFYQARESSLVPVGFLTSQCLQKLWFSQPLLWWGNRVMLLCIAFLEERESFEKLGRMTDGLSPTLFFSIQAIQRNPALVPSSQQMLHTLRFLQKLGCQKPCWDLARLSSLVKKNKLGILVFKHQPPKFYLSFHHGVLCWFLDTKKKIKSY